MTADANNRSVLFVHGRDFKPAADVYLQIAVEAVRTGLARDYPDCAERFDQMYKGLAWYGDLSAEVLQDGAMFYRDGSGTLDLCYVACGRLIGYVEPHIMAWDSLAAVAILEGAGGRVSDMLAGDAMWEGAPIVASTPALYPILAGYMGISSNGAG